VVSAVLDATTVESVLVNSPIAISPARIVDHDEPLAVVLGAVTVTVQVEVQRLTTPPAALPAVYADELKETV